jgi:hypothetical protein
MHCLIQIKCCVTPGVYLALLNHKAIACNSSSSLVQHLYACIWTHLWREALAISADDG